jgi:hypothetical protein
MTLDILLFSNTFFFFDFKQCKKKKKREPFRLGTNALTNNPHKSPYPSRTVPLSGNVQKRTNARKLRRWEPPEVALSRVTLENFTTGSFHNGKIPRNIIAFSRSLADGDVPDRVLRRIDYGFG